MFFANVPVVCWRGSLFPPGEMLIGAALGKDTAGTGHDVIGHSTGRAHESNFTTEGRTTKNLGMQAAIAIREPCIYCRTTVASLVQFGSVFSPLPKARVHEIEASASSATCAAIGGVAVSSWTLNCYETVFAALSGARSAGSKPNQRRGTVVAPVVYHTVCREVLGVSKENDSKQITISDLGQGKTVAWQQKGRIVSSLTAHLGCLPLRANLGSLELYCHRCVE
ncbi:hypothetical protein CCHOA_04330 [Corynebacterium choanae]|uniref:Uncharacterized protein n=1 Tax=Corynebacterium choanae TaxID=1862358 RepID=A0A3G6J5A6_9CORY|nr:hypothetical protein CCHOA_04330 [Corynebacterium choanae]